MLIGGLLAAIVLAHYFTRLSGVLLFWAAFVLTRPFGATVGDLLTKPVAKGGLALGTVGSSVVLSGVLVAMVAYASITQARRSEPVTARIAQPAGK
ncbi:hypothetical protein QM261_17980 [Acinetobacter baumannii]|nr:hypothetical protein [Acinetobacter baumannii]